MAKYYDVTAVMQVIGGIYINPSLLELEEKYHFNEEDFSEDFHRILFGSIYNLYKLGATEINLNTIEDYLEQKPKKYAVYTANHGAEYLMKLVDNVTPNAFDYYYNRMKKMTLLRMYNNVGLDVKWIYDTDNILDLKKKQKQEEWLDNHDILELADIIDQKISEISLKYVDNLENEFISADKGLEDLVRRLEQTPEVGYPLYGRIVNAIHRGARLKKFYLRSAATGVGKSRTMIADITSIAVSEIFDLETNSWIENGSAEPAMYITTEQDEDEVQTMMLAFVSAVNEEHIITGNYLPGERERVAKAIRLINEAQLYIKKLPDFSLQDIENTIKYGIKEYDCRYIGFDYIHSSMKILSEIGSRSGVKGLREDNILFLISVRLKDLCNKYGVFILTSTQLNASYVDADVYDQNLLRGAKSIADKIDVGMIMLPVTQEDREGLQEVVSKLGVDMPTIKISVYKNRRGRYKDVLLWCKADLGICRVDPIFVTDYRKELIPIEDLKIKVRK